MGQDTHKKEAPYFKKHTSPKIIWDVGMLELRASRSLVVNQNVSLIGIFLDKFYTAREDCVAPQNNAVNFSAFNRISNPSSSSRERGCVSN